MSTHFDPITIDLTSQGRAVRVHLFSAGAIAEKIKFHESRNRLSALAAIIDSHFTGWLPIWVMVIQHPEGTYLVDTGMDPAVMRPGYFRSSGFLVNWFDTTQYRYAIDSEEVVHQQLAALDIPIADIKAVILTHLHFDHVGGLAHFPTTPILAGEAEARHPYGALPKLYPPWFKPTLITLDTPLGPFKKTRALTAAEDLALIHTPGHTPGHCSVLLHADQASIFFAGDSCISQDQLLQEKYPAGLASRRSARQTYAAIKAFARHHPLVLLPTHDPGAATRLRQLQTLP
ncbi:N-acyl homoserine lactonase family protein [Puia dinghuensis]|uniref:N-acyl homoserine lactonase family protein n=1 Tax=Puia dinghuensis TaxID=1792502 RepID=A0A8J2UHX2_9BACT|nr:N-acyl homoserine lactonase family protein [Puia dinghuensis]GGB18175.1 N-acyl homoserine lactonase family protein [Puia dinghuensis]